MTPPRIIAVGEEPPPMDQTPAGEHHHHNGKARGKAKGKTKAGERFAVLNTFVDFASLA